MNIEKQKCPECGEEVQAFNMENHQKNHALEKAKAEKQAEKK